MMNVFLSRILLLVFCFLLTTTSSAQQGNDSCNLQLSLLTCSPGDELYSIFGHSALRVKDESRGFDIIFNYGTFDFDDPEFYTKFVKGKLLYFVSTQNFQDFAYGYQMENRSIIEQQLQLTCEQKAQLFNDLQVNLQEANKFYLYDFLFDNCSTRLRDIVANSSSDQVHFGNIIPTPAPTFRDLIHIYLREGNQYWSKLGIDMLLGNKLDKRMENEQAMFLPDFLMEGFDSATINNVKLVGSKNTILTANQNKEKSSILLRPVSITILILLVFGSMHFIRKKWAGLVLDAFDTIFFFVLGILGCLMIFMWFGTDHVFCRNNFNLVWALPTHLLLAFFIYSRKRWVRNYFRIMALWYFVLFFAWALLPQDMNSAFVPVVVLAFIRSYCRYRKT